MKCLAQSMILFIQENISLLGYSYTCIWVMEIKLKMDNKKSIDGKQIQCRWRRWKSQFSVTFRCDPHLRHRSFKNGQPNRKKKKKTYLAKESTHFWGGLNIFQNRCKCLKVRYGKERNQWQVNMKPLQTGLIQNMPWYTKTSLPEYPGWISAISNCLSLLCNTLSPSKLDINNGCTLKD